MIRMKCIYIILFAIVLLNLGITISTANIGGSWKMGGDFGADMVELKQSGNHVYGAYPTPGGQGMIDGQIYAGNIWRGLWTDRLGFGHFMVTFSDDFNSFSGSWERGRGFGGGALQGEKVVVNKNIAN